MGSVVAGWYDDGSGRVRWWDGARWTEQVADSPPASSTQPVPPGGVAPTAPGAPQTMGAVTATEKAPPKISFFGGRKAALAYAAENDRLEGVIQRYGLRDLIDLDREKAAQQSQVDAVLAELHGVREQLDSSRRELSEIQGEIIDARAKVELQSYGMYEFGHPAEASTTLLARLEGVRAQAKEMVRDKSATNATSNFTFNNSAAKGRKFVADMSKLLLRAYNAEAENCVKTVRAGNLEAAAKRLSTVVDQIARQGSMIDLRIAPRYHQLRLEELSLASRHLQAVQAEKELERAHREELREQRKAEQELARQQEKLEKEKSHYASTLSALEAKGDLEGAERVRARLADVARALEDVEYRAANIRAGYVYVISNIGSFGPDVVKIGMTRRLEPMDRVNELGDASVPFRFDVHALFFADDAVGIESMLHKNFASQRLNTVNLRREYFRTRPEDVLAALKDHSVEVLEFRIEPEAIEYRASISA